MSEQMSLGAVPEQSSGTGLTASYTVHYSRMSPGITVRPRKAPARCGEIGREPSVTAEITEVCGHEGFERVGIPRHSEKFQKWVHSEELELVLVGSRTKRKPISVCKKARVEK